MGEGHHARQLAHEGAAVGDRHQRIFVGEPLEIADSLARLAKLAAQRVDLGHQPHDRLAQLGGELGLADAGEIEDVDRLRRRGGAVGNGPARLGLAGGAGAEGGFGIADFHNAYGARPDSAKRLQLCQKSPVAQTRRATAAMVACPDAPRTYNARLPRQGIRVG